MYHRSETEEKRGKEKPLEHIESGRSYMKYAIIGAGGCGGSIGAFLAEAGQDVTLIARGEHLAAIREHGICVESPSRTFTVTDIKAVDEAGYAEIPDVLFVCVKGYSIPDIIPFLREHSDAETLIVPILNIYGTGAKLQQAYLHCGGDQGAGCDLTKRRYLPYRIWRTEGTGALPEDVPLRAGIKGSRH